MTMMMMTMVMKMRVSHTSLGRPTRRTLTCSSLSSLVKSFFFVFFTEAAERHADATPAHMPSGSSDV